MFKRLFVPALMGAMVVALGTWLMTSPYWSSLRKVGMVMRVLHDEYVDPGSVGYPQLAEAAVKGMAASLDSYTAYMPREEYSHFAEITRQNYVGIGVEIEQIDDTVTVVRVFPGGPAAQSGVLPGDRIAGINGEDVRGWSVAEVSERMRGPEGESVTVEVLRLLTGGNLTFDITRRRVRIASVEDAAVDPDGIGYLRITQFGDETGKEFRAALRTMEASGLRGLIIDLRNNPGGILHVAKAVAGEFFDRGELVVYTEGRDRASRRDYLSENDRARPEYPLAVLVNERSASGAEIVAGALQDTGRAVVVGEKSYGKGSVQSVYGFRGGDGMRQTTALYYLPSGRSINETGVIPDVTVELSDEEELARLLAERHLRYMSAEEFRTAFDRDPSTEDPQLQRARELIVEDIRIHASRQQI